MSVEGSPGSRRSGRAWKAALPGLALAAAVLGAATVPARAEYKIQRGDTVEISVFGSPELTRRTTVDIDGQSNLPLVGPVEIAGLSIAEVRAKVSQLLSEGKLVKTPEVTVDVAEYRPIYIRGDVMSPGAFPFRPGMTIRQALAFTGGAGLKAGGAGASSPAGLADLRGEFATVSTDLASRQAHLDRLRAELQGRDRIDFTAIQSRSLAPDLAAKFRDLEAQQLNAIRAGHDKASDHLKLMAGFASDQLDTLERQRKEVEESIRLQSDEVDKVKSLFLKGMITSTRLTDEQRSLSAARTQLLSNIAQAGDVRRIKADFDDKVRASTDEHTLQTMKDFQQTLFDIEKLRVRLIAAGQKLVAAKDSGAPPATGAGDGRSFAVYRVPGNDRTPLPATEDTELLPGDVVEVKSDDTLVMGVVAPPPQAARPDQASN
jgi:polysaccharide export outer membrane protein